MAVLTAVVLLATEARHLLGRASVQRFMQRATGVIFIGLGARLALSRR